MNTSATFTPSETENAIEIASECLEFLQERFKLGRDALVRNFIFPWAREAEVEWSNLQTASDDTPYYDFIMAFSDRKKTEVEAQQKAGGLHG